MFACMAHIARLGPIPPSLKITLFSACVRSVLLYGADAIPLSKGQGDLLDDVPMHYTRWSLRLSKTSNRADTLIETGQVPLSVTAAQARVKYFVLTQSRRQDHVATDVLRELTSLKARSRRRGWVNLVEQSLEVWECDREKLGQLPDLSRRRHKSSRAVTSEYISDKAVAWWQRQATAPPADKPTPSWLA